MDQTLVVRARDGDREAFAALVRAVGDRLYALAYRLLRDADQAQDAYQETMVTAWRQLAYLRDPGALRGLDPPHPRPPVLRGDESAGRA